MKANSVILGSLVATGNRVRISATLHGPDGASLATAQVDGAQDSVLSLVDDLSAELVRGIWRSKEPVPSLRVSAITTNSLDAMKAFLEGERLYRRSRWDSAQAAYTRAVEIDSTFSLAYLRLGATIGWQGGYGAPAAIEASAAALRYASRLPARERAWVAAYALFNSGQVTATDSMRRYVAQYPTDIEGWFLLGETLYHSRVVNALPSDSIRAPFDRVLALDSSLVPAAIHPAELAVQSLDGDLVKRYTDLMRRAGSPEEGDAYVAAFDIAVGRAIADSATIARIGTRTGPITAALGALPMRPGATSDTVALAAAGLWGALRGLPVQVLMGEAIGKAGFGRFDEAAKLADSLQKLDPNLAINARLYPVSVGIAPDGIDGGLDRVMGGPRVNPFQVHGIAQIAMVRGDYALAIQLIDSLAQDTTKLPAPLRGLVISSRGRILVHRGDTAAGIRLLREGIARSGEGGGFARAMSAPGRLALADVLVARPATRAEGIERLENGFDSDYGLAAHLSLLLGRAYEAAGDKPRAIQAYSRFLRLWDKPSARALPRANEAREALKQLTGEGQPLVR